MLYDFDTVINRWHTDSEKYDGLKKFAPKAPDNSIPLWIADMDFKTAPEIIAAMHKRVDEVSLVIRISMMHPIIRQFAIGWKSVITGILHRTKLWWIQAWFPRCPMPCH